MLNNYFYQSNGEKKLQKFFGKAKRLAIVVDPPFGSLTDALEKSLEKLRELFNVSQVGTIVFLPYFTGKRLHGMSILDYKVSIHFNKKCFMSRLLT
jgi:hypothetical protein